MLTRADWKRIKRKGVGLPPGPRHQCSCGKLMVVEITTLACIIHHELPYCPNYEKLKTAADFLTLNATLESERDAALAKLVSELKRTTTT